MREEIVYCSREKLLGWIPNNISDVLTHDDHGISAEQLRIIDSFRMALKFKVSLFRSLLLF